MTQLPEPEEFTIETKRGEIQGYRAIDGQEYIIMKNAPKYLGTSKYVSDKILYSKESSGELEFFHFEGLGHKTWLLRSDLDKIRAEILSPKPFKIQKKPEAN